LTVESPTELQNNVKTNTCRMLALSVCSILLWYARHVADPELIGGMNLSACSSHADMRVEDPDLAGACPAILSRHSLGEDGSIDAKADLSRHSFSEGGWCGEGELESPLYPIG